MSVATEPALADATGKLVDAELEIALAACTNGFMDIPPTADRMMVDPRLAMQFPASISDKPSEPTFAISPSTIWDQHLDGSTPLFCQPKNGEESMEINDDDDDADSIAIASFEPHDATIARKASRTSSDASLPSLTSSASSHDSQPKKRARKPPRKKLPKQNPIPEKSKEDSSRRNKYLERNRLAASKCRQKKKEWVHELEETKASLEAKHHTLQREYAALLDEISQIKTFLMSHSGCNDPNIDQWIEGEARRFVKKSIDGTFNTLEQRSSNTPPPLPTSESRQSSTVSANQYSPTASSPDAAQFLPAPIKREEINFDHMPDDMFQ